jgi:hypothetical protein
MFRREVPQVDRRSQTLTTLTWCIHTVDACRIIGVLSHSGLSARICSESNQVRHRMKRGHVSFEGAGDPAAAWCAANRDGRFFAVGSVAPFRLRRAKRVGRIRLASACQLVVDRIVLGSVVIAGVPTSSFVSYRYPELPID